MTKNILPPWRKSLSVLVLFPSFFITTTQGQSSISISWDSDVGCQTYDIIRDKDGEIFIEDIQASECIRVCAYSNITYKLTNVPSTATITWNIVGGTSSNTHSALCTVDWGTAGAGSISFTVTEGNSITNKTICIEKIISPKALFEIAPLGSGTISTCAEQLIHFTNLSQANNGTSPISYLWDFGDGNFSTAFEPSHTYAQQGQYTVRLLVRNECNCTDSYSMDVMVEGVGFEISCPTVICEGKSAIYSLAKPIADNCKNGFNWSVIGGQIISTTHGQVEVLWDNIDENGFGYLTFDPSNCDLDCIEATTIKVPVIQRTGTIQGTNNICVGEQGRYKLPQWPTTDIQWEIIGNVGNNIAEIIQTDQRNEIIIEPYTVGTFTLRATYQNTLLKCGGEASFTFKVEKPLSILGESTLCENSTEIYTNSLGIPTDWTLTTSTGTVVNTQSNTIDFNYTFNQAGNYILTADQTGFCSDKQKIITVLETLEVGTTIVGDSFVCANVPYSYAVQSPAPNSIYIWEIDPSQGVVIGASEGNEVNINFNGNFPAELRVYKKSIHPIECKSSALSFIVNKLPVDVVLSEEEAEVCSNSLAHYSAYQNNTTVLYNDGDEYIWSLANASPNTIPATSLGSITSGQGTNAIELIWNNVDTLTTVDLVLNVRKCNTYTTFTKQITIYPKTEITLIADTTTVCGGSLYALMFTVEAANSIPFTGMESITWEFSNHNTITTLPGVLSCMMSFNNAGNNGTGNITYPISAYIPNGSCGESNTAKINITVLPNPEAIITLSSSFNTFCDSADVDATITLSSNASGVSFQWYKDGNLLLGETATSLHVTAAMGAGKYSVQVTNSNTCVAVSNEVEIFVKSCIPPECTLPYTVQNNAALTACGEITLTGTANGPVINEEWQILGTSVPNYHIVGNILSGKPGNYKIRYKAEYLCPGTNVTVGIEDIKELVIPYEADFSYTTECTSNNTFNINFIDESSFYALVSPKNVRFYYKELSAANFIGPISYDPDLSVFELTNLAAGDYIFRQEIDGNYPNTPTFTCEKEYTLSLMGVDTSNIGLEINRNAPISCYNTAVQFDFNPSLSLGINVLWDFDDDGAKNKLGSVRRVFNTPNSTYNVSCMLSNGLGCSVEYIRQVSIPEVCFFGDIVSTPSSARVCKNENVVLTYVPNGDNCAATKYIWMNGNIPISTTTSPSLTVNTSGFYWVKVVSSGDCEYSSPTQIRPLFETLPNVKLIGESTVCLGKDIKYRVSTNAPTIRWYLGTSLYSQFNDLLEADFTGLLGQGNYTLSVEVSSANACTNTATMDISVEAALTSISFNLNTQCTPYALEIQAIPTPNSPNIVYNWSNGANTDIITVQEGGPYRVVASLGACSITNEIDLPKDPENYLWIYPSGCYTECYAWDSKEGYLLSPTLPLSSWDWNRYGNPVQSGTNSYQDFFQLDHSGTISSTINTGFCSKESQPLDYTLKDCIKCEFKLVSIKEKIKDSPYCAFEYSLELYSYYPYPFQVTISDNSNNVLILPSSFTIQPGSNNLQFTVIPQSSFAAGGATTWTIQGTVYIKEEAIDCITHFKVEVPPCDPMYNAKKAVTELPNEIAPVNLLQVFPNPARGEVNLRYELAAGNARIELYDLSGRAIAKHNLEQAKGEMSLKLSSYQAGIYILVLRQSDGYILQEKLIIE